MPKVNHTQKAFNAGELTPKLLARSDFDKYETGAAIMENAIPTVQGTAVKREGTKYAAETKDSTDNSILYPFTDTNGTNYILEFGALYIRFFKEDGTVVGGPYEVVTPYTVFYLDDLQFAQSGDVLYIACDTYAPRKLSKNSSSDTDWSLSELSFEWQPFQDENRDDTKEFYVSAYSGTGITITAVGHSPFTPNWATDNLYIKFRDDGVGPASVYREWKAALLYALNNLISYNDRVYRCVSTSGTAGSYPPTHTFGIRTDGGVDWEYLNSGSGYAKITGYTSPTQVTADVIIPLPASIVGSGNETFRWAYGCWGNNSTGIADYPRAITIHENRLIFGGSSVQPQTVWGSVSGDYENFETGTEDDKSFQYTLGSDELNEIYWANAGKVLLIGTQKAEFAMSGTRIYEAITPTNIRVARQTNYGSTVHRPVRMGDRIFFTEKSNLRLRELAYDYSTEGYIAKDVTVLSEHITAPTIAQGAKQESPYPILWYPRYFRRNGLGDGVLIGLTYDSEQGVFSWHRHNVGGVVESVAVLSKTTQDQVWMIVKRTVNGATVRYVEYMDFPSEVDIEDSHYVDCGVFYNGASTSTITGLSHLEGETVKVVADGAVQLDKTVSSGQITLDSAASKVHVGYGFDTNVKTMPIVVEDRAVGLNSRITTITLRLLSTGEGLSVGPDAANLKNVNLRKPGDAMDAPVPLYSGLIGPLDWHEGFNREEHVHVQHNLPLPFELCSITADIMVYDE